jgi:hypothetical protein
MLSYQPFNIPSDTEKFLVEAYGEKWKIPDSNWKWWQDPKCIDLEWNIDDKI